MNESSDSFEADLGIPLKWVAGAMIGASFVIAFLANIPRAIGDKMMVMVFAVVMGGTAGVAWQLDDKRPEVGSSLIVAVLTGIVYGGSLWLGAPQILALLALPVATAAALLGLRAAFATATGITLLLGLYAATIENVDIAVLVVTPVGVWCLFALLYAIYGPVYQVARWAWEYYQRAQRLMDESLDRQVQLKQALEDLADANQQLTRLNLVAQGLRQHADDARIAKEQFVANVSHELRTPLNMVVGFSEMIVEMPETYGRVPPALLADLDVVHRNAQHLSELIDDVLDLSQIDAGEMALTQEYVSLREIVAVATTAVRPLYDSKGLWLDTEIPPDLPPVYCDPTRVREVMLNLLSNAGRFTERGGVRVSVRQQADGTVVSVSDTGPGIAQEDLGKLFQPFQQVDGSIRRRYGGTGLGLSISKRFIELHGGHIWVESEIGVGTAFHFRLPEAVPTAEAYARWLTPDWEYKQRTRRSAAPIAAVRPRFVLSESGGALERLLRRHLADIDIVPVTDLSEALQELSRLPAQALLINETSVGRTLEALGDMAALPPDVPVLVCSVPGLHEPSTKSYVIDRLIKPISREALSESLDRLQVKGGTALIVDDEPDALQLFGRMLASLEHKYHVLLARDGQEALGILDQCQPDVILLDLVMPHMDGFQLLELKNKEPALRDIPVIIVSARDPVGQPIVSSALAVTRGGGLSVRQLVDGIECLARSLGVVGSPDYRLDVAASRVTLST
jgi:signal transduction histidine kinase/CheY-like chemotaxis protein